MEWKKSLDNAKKLHRPSLKDWSRDGFYEKFSSYVQLIESKHSQYESFSPSDGEINYFPNLPIVANANTLSRSKFVRKIEDKNLPAIIRQIPVSENWEAREKWKLENLQKDEELCERRFSCGEDDDGKSIKVKLKHFFSYMKNNRDDSPLYIFDANFDRDHVSKKLLDQYRVPSYFEHDLFHLVGNRRRPPHRWFLVGPERSGATIHVDPLGTSAWNTLLSGKKRWILFPPHVPKSIVKGRDLIRRHEDDEPVHYFTTIFPRTKQRAVEMMAMTQDGSNASRDYDNEAVEEWKKFTCCYEFTQMTGDTVFIPNGWWHAVLNLTHTVAVTQNFCSFANFEKVWVKTRSGRKKMAGKWLAQLEDHHPHLATRARELNRLDGFKMSHDPLVSSQKQRERHHKKKRKKHRSGQKKNKTNTKESGEADNVNDSKNEHETKNIAPPSKRKRL